MGSAYFTATVQRKLTEPVSTTIRYGFLWLKKKEQKTGDLKYYLICKLTGVAPSDAMLRLQIEVGKEVYDQAEAESRLSIHLAFKYEYSCCHFLIGEPEEEQIIKTKGIISEV